MMHPGLARVADLFIVTAFTFVVLVVPNLIDKL